jgi:hypothetical protein
MSRIDVVVNSFQSGEISPWLYGRTETDFYKKGCRHLENLHVLVEGGVHKRGGSKFSTAAYKEDKPVRLLPFNFTADQAYVMEFGDEYVRIITRDGVLLDPNDPTKDYVVESPYTSEQLQQVQYVQSADVVFLVHPDIRPKEFARSLDSQGKIKWEFSDYDYEDGPYQTINGNEDYKLAPSATTGTGKTITATGFTPFTQSMVGGYIRLKANAKYGYAKITGYTSSTVVTVDIIKDFDATTATTDFYLPAWSDDLGWPSCVSLYEQRIAMGRTKNEPQGFWLSVSGDFYKYTPTDETGQVTDDNAMNSLILAGTRVSLISFIVGTQNLVFGTGGGLYRTNTTNGAPLAAKTARVLYDNGTECADIQPIQIGTLILFTQRQRKKLFSAQYDFAADALVDNNVAQFARHLIHSPIKEIALQREPYDTLWAVLDDGTLRACTYNPSQGLIAWNRVTFGGYFRGGNPLVESITTISGYNEDNLWAVVRRTINGQERRYIERIVEDQNIGQEFSFYVDSGAVIEDKHTITNIQVGENVITVTTADAHGFVNDDQVNFYDIVVQAVQTEATVEPGNSINGLRSKVTVVNTTSFTIPRATGTEYSDYISGGIVRKYLTVLTGLDHLEGQYVQILADGAVRPAKKVESGTVTLDRGSAVTVVGLGYNAILSPVQYEAISTSFPTLQNQRVRNVQTMIQVLNSLGMKFGVNLDKLDIKSFRSTSDKMDTAVPLFTGKVEINPPSNYSLDEAFYLVNDQPLPFSITSMVYELSVK